MLRAAFITLLATVLAAQVVAAQNLPSGTLLVSNMDDDSVWLIDMPTGERRALVRTHVPPHEVAVSNDGGTAVVMNYGNGQRGPGNLIQVVDVNSGEVTRELTVASYERLHSAAFLEGDSLLAVTSEATGEILILGLVDGLLRRSMSTGGQVPHMLSLGGDWIYAANIVDGTVSRVDPQGDLMTNVWPAGTRTEGVAATPDGLEVWTGSMDAGSVIGVRGETGEVVARVEGLGVPYRLAVTPDGETVVVSDPGAGTLVLIDRSSGTIAAAVDIDSAASEQGFSGESSPQGFVLSPAGDWAFLTAKGLNRVAMVHLPSRRVVSFLDTAAGPDGIAFSPLRP